MNKINEKAKNKIPTIQNVVSNFTKNAVINILKKRADNTYYNFHEHERNEILKAIDIITKHVPPSSFPDWQIIAK